MSRTYKDARWLKGYTEGTWGVHLLREECRTDREALAYWKARTIRIARQHVQWFGDSMDDEERGSTDAWLDAVGC